MTGWKVFTHDRRSPIRGGDPVWDGTYPYTLPKVTLDTSDEECGAGWSYCEDLATAFRIAGLWPDGRSALAVAIEPGEDDITRGDKWRGSQITLLRSATREEIEAAIRTLSEPFGDLADEMAREQMAWYDALGRPRRDPDAVAGHLLRALGARNLAWGLRRFKTARDAWTAWDARAAWDVWDAWTAWDARAAGDVWAARAAWSAKGAWAARDAWDVWAARDALIVYYAARRGWTDVDPHCLTTGIRDAYAAGLGIAVPVVEPNALGWTMEG